MTKKEALKKARASNRKKSPHTLTKQQELFCHEYIKDRNGTQAAIRAGYSAKTAGALAYQLFKNIYIKGRVNQLISAELGNIDATAARIKRELTNLAFINIADAYDQNGALKPFEDMPVELQRAILAVESEELFDGQGKNREQIGYTKRIKLTDKLKALEMLGRHQKMFTDITEHKGLENLAEELKAARLRSGQIQPCQIPFIPLHLAQSSRS
jgi:phage terminase small subunit